MRTTAIRVREPVHGLGEEEILPSLPMRQALAWWLAAELVRRHPDEAPSIAENHRYGVMLDVSVGGRRLSLATEGHLTLHVAESSWEPRLNWLDVLLAENRRVYVVEQVERVLELEVPRQTPPTVRASIGPRLLAGFFARTALFPLRWQACCGFLISHADDDAWVVEQLFEAMPEVDADRRARPDTASDYWFLCPSLDMLEPGKPVAAVDVVTGRAWRADGEVVDLLQRYDRLGRRLDALVSHVLPPAF